MSVFAIRRLLYVGILLVLVFRPLFSRPVGLDLTENCSCSSNSCLINVGVLAGLSLYEDTAVREAIFVINRGLGSFSKWRVNITHLGRDNQPLLRGRTGHTLSSVIADQVLASELSVLIGPESSVVVEWIHPMMVMLNITHIAPLASNPTFLDPGRFPNLIRMVPDDNYQLQAVINLLGYFHYTQMSLLTSDDEYGLSMVEVFRRNSYKSKVYELKHVVMLQITTNNTNIRFNLLQINQSEPHLVVLATDRWLGHKIVTEAYQLNMTTPREWMWLAMDAMTSVPVENIRINGKTLRFQELLGLRPRIDTHKIHEQLNLTHLTNISFTVERYIDSFLLVADRIKQICKGSKEVKGYTSPSIPYFDHRRTTLPVIYDVLQSDDTDWSVIGQWSSDNSQSPMEQLSMAKGSRSIRPANRLKITTIIDRPFVYFENSNETDPSKLQGYCIDMLKELSTLADFEYDIHLVKDGQYGGLDETAGQWNGMIGEVMRGEADLAVASITLTEQRSKVVDFLPPFLRLDLKFLIRRLIEKGEEYNPFAFLYPFDISLYRAILISVILMAIFLCALAKISPYGIRGRFFHTARAEMSIVADQAAKELSSSATKMTLSERKLREDRKDAKSGMGLNNAFYFVWAALFWQTPERVPRSVSARIITITWYLAAVVFVASYTANLVTIVSMHAQEENTIQSVEDLMLQRSIAYGTVANSAVETHLNKSQSVFAKKLYKSIVNDETSFNHLIPNVSAGVRLTEQGDYALIWDSLSLDFITAIESECRLKTVSLGFGTVEYAVAIKKSSPHYSSLTRHMLAIKARGSLQHLHDQYFREADGCRQWDNYDHSTRRLTFTDLAGIFYLVAMAMGTGFVVLIVEWIVAIFYDVNAVNPNAPQSMAEAFRIRSNRLTQDIRMNWFPVDRTVEKWSKLSLPTQDVAQEIVRRKVDGQLGRNPSQHEWDLHRSRSTIT